MELNGWRNQNLDRAYFASASKGAVAQPRLWSWSEHGRGKRGAGLDLENTPAHELIKDTNTQVQGHTVRACGRARALKQAYCHTKITRRRSLWCPSVFVPEAKSHNHPALWSQCCSGKMSPPPPPFHGGRHKLVFSVKIFGADFHCVCQNKNHASLCTAPMKKYLRAKPWKTPRGLSDLSSIATAVVSLSTQRGR